MHEQNTSSSCLPVVIAPLFIVVALLMIAAGWALDNGYLNQAQLTQKLPDVVQTVIVEAERIVVPNGEQQEVVVLPNGDLPQPIAVPNLPNAPFPVALAAASAPAFAVVAKQSSAPSPTITYPVALTVTVTAQPVITVTATAEPVITVTATVHSATATAAVIVATAAAATVTAMNIVIPPDCYEWKADHCAVWNTPIPSQTPIPTLTQGPPPTEMPTSTQGPPPTVTPWPTPTPTATPENNEVSSIVTLQGATNHAGIVVSAVGLGGLEWHEMQVPGQAVTNEVGSFKLSGLSRGRYKLTAYTTTGSHIPVCMEIDLSGAGSIVISQTMLSNGGLEVEGDSENLNLAAQAIFRHKFGLSIPEHLIPILDVSHDGIFNETDYNMIVAEPTLMGCNPW